MESEQFNSVSSSYKKTSFQRSSSQSRTQLEHATNWGRAFTNLLTDLKWLNSYAKLNVVICQKSIQRMAKNYLEISDNVIEKQLLVRTKQIGHRFFQSKDIDSLSNDIINFYAVRFTQGDVMRAKKILEVDGQNFIRKEEVGAISFYGGIVAGQFPLTLYLLFLRGYSNLNTTLRGKAWINTEFIFRLFFFVAIIILGTASCI